MEFNIEGSPPSQEELEHARRCAHGDIEIQRKRLYPAMIGAALAAVASIITAALILFGNKNFNTQDIAGVAIIMEILIGLFLFIAVIVAFTLYRKADRVEANIVFAYAVVGMAMLIIESAAVALGGMDVLHPVFLGFAYAIFAFVPALFVAAYLETKLVKPAKEVQATLRLLEPLDAAQKPGECVVYASWVDQSSAVYRYQQKVASQCRQPVMGEFCAAKTWMNDNSDRQKKAQAMAQAKEACRRMASV